MQDKPRFELGRTLSAGPGAFLLPWNSDATIRAPIVVPCRTFRHGQERGSNLLERRPGQARYAMRDPVVTVLRVPAEVTIQSISHVYELLGNNNLERAGP